MAQFPAAGNDLVIGGMPLPALAKDIGRTPFYAYDKRVMAETVERLRNELPDEIRLHYAIKANPMVDVVRHMATLVDGLDVASGRELATALTTQTPRRHISFAGPAKSNDELAQAINAGIVINLESEGELRRVAEIGQSTNVVPQLAVRVNPDFELKTSGMKMGGGPKPFGVDEERVPAMFNEIHRCGAQLVGLHIYSGSQNLRPDSIIDAHNQTFELAAKLAGQANMPLKILNIGGGFGIPYFPGDTHLDLAPIGENLEQLLLEAKPYLPEAEVVIELGRYLVGESGIYVCEVIDRKISKGHTFLITNGGLHHHLAASGNFGQVIRKNYPVAIGNRIGMSEGETVSIVGPLCTPLDILADKMWLPKAKVGDLVVVYQSGAYGLSASPTAFLSHPEPAEVLV